jgi:hypothetical protein
MESRASVSATQVRCGSCGELIDEPPDTPAAQRISCPRCGDTSRTRTIEASASLQVKATLSTHGSVERGLNDLRLAVLGILVGIGLTVGIGFDATWWVGVLAGGGSFGLAAGLIRWPRSRHWMMTFMHRITGK